MQAIPEWHLYIPPLNTLIMFLIGVIGWFLRSDVKEIKDRLWRLEQQIFNREPNGRKGDVK